MMLSGLTRMTEHIFDYSGGAKHSEQDCLSGLKGIHGVLTSTCLDRAPRPTATRAQEEPGAADGSMDMTWLLCDELTRIRSK